MHGQGVKINQGPGNDMSPSGINDHQILGYPIKEWESGSGVLGKLLCTPMRRLTVVLASRLRLPSPGRGSVRLVAVIIEQLFASANPFFGKDAYSVITSHHDNLGIAIWIRGMVGKLQLVTHSVRIKDKLHSRIDQVSRVYKNKILTACHKDNNAPTSLFRLKRNDEFSRSYIFPRLSASLWEISSPVYSPRYSCLPTLF
jgi:hypothetical protein